MKFVLCIALLSFCLAGCMQAHSEDDLRGVPVTNNPNLLPRTGQMAQGAPF